MLERDIRDTALYREIFAFYESLHAPGMERVTDATDIAIRPDGAKAAFTGSIYRDMQTHPVTRICTVDLTSGHLDVRSAPGGNDRMPRWSPDGRQLAFLSDRRETGNYQLYVCDAAAATEAVPAADIEGTIEYLQWSPDGSQLLLGVAGFGADFAGCQGGHKTLTRTEALPPWAPLIDSGDAQNLWRRLFVWERTAGSVRAVSPIGTNFWEACWLGNQQLAAVTSGSHSEGSWYEAVIQSLDVGTGTLRLLYAPMDQVGSLTGSPSGKRLAFVEAVCSDRMIVAGTLKMIPTDTLAPLTCDTRQVDVTHATWRNEDHLTYTGIRSLETVIGEIDVQAGAASGREYWVSQARTIGGFNPVCAPVTSGGAVAVSEAYDVPPPGSPSLPRPCNAMFCHWPRRPLNTRASIEPASNPSPGWPATGWKCRAG